MDLSTKHSLKTVIEKWILDTQESDDGLDMWISATLVDAMTDAAWVVVKESRDTQEWMKKEGVLESLGSESA